MKDEALITVEELAFTYPRAIRASLNGVSFSLRNGEVYGFLGPSGAGKSTTQKVLYGLLKEYSGSVRLFGNEVRDSGGQIYSLMGIAFETPNLYLKLTGRENLEFAMSLRASRRRAGGGVIHSATAQQIDAALERLGLLDSADRRVETYSKGMRMRLSFVRAVVHEPPLLFLDEPTSGLDPLWARVVKDWIVELRTRGTAVFLTTHSMELADEVCQTVGFLVDGSLVAQDEPIAFKQRYGRPAITVHGIDTNGKTTQLTVGYQELLERPLRGLQQVTRVVNREVTLEQVFLQLTGRTLGGAPA